MTPKALGIYYKTSRGTAELRLHGTQNRAISHAESILNWARRTGRINGTAELAIRALTGYEYTKLVISIAEQMAKEFDMSAVARRLNEVYGYVVDEKPPAQQDR
jgi:hypothetical protein